MRCVQPLFAGHHEFSSGWFSFPWIAGPCQSKVTATSCGKISFLFRSTLSSKSGVHCMVKVELLATMLVLKAPSKVVASGGWAFTYCCSTHLLIKNLLRAPETHYFSEWKMIHFSCAMFSAGSQSPSPTWWSRFIISSLSPQRIEWMTRLPPEGSEQMWNLGSGDNTQPNFKAHSLRSMV